jgi:hypothetical protein
MVHGDSSCSPVVSDLAERLLSALASGADDEAATGASNALPGAVVFCTTAGAADCEDGCVACCAWDDGIANVNANSKTSATLEQRHVLHTSAQ